jgi:hypothetical protein
VLSAAYSDGFYACVCILAFGAFVHAWRSTGRQAVRWAFVTSLALGVAWNTRPENLLLFGFLVVAGVVVIADPNLEGTTPHRARLRSLLVLIAR